jgi:hypothetical protein
LTAKERLEHAQRELAQLRSRINRSTGLTVMVGIVLLLLLGGYFYYGSKLWAEVSEPENLVNLAQQKFDDNIPQARKALEKAVVKESPSWAAALSKQLLDSVPDARKELQKFVVDQIEAQIQETELVTEAEFRKFLKKHRSAINAKFDELKNDKSGKLAEASLAEIAMRLEQDMQANFKADAADLLKVLKNLNRNARDMLSTKLTESQALEKTAWMLGRTLVLKTTDPELLKKLQIKASPTPKVISSKRRLPLPPGGKKGNTKPKIDDKKPDNGKPAKDGKTDQSRLTPSSLERAGLADATLQAPSLPAARNRCWQRNAV